VSEVSHQTKNNIALDDATSAMRYVQDVYQRSGLVVGTVEQKRKAPVEGGPCLPFTAPPGLRTV
jgi:hypothetical protein